MDDFGFGVQIVEFQGRIFPLEDKVWPIVNDVICRNSIAVPL